MAEPSPDVTCPACGASVVTQRPDGTLFIHTRAISVDLATQTVRIKCRQCKAWVDRVRGPIVRSLVVALSPAKAPSST